MNICCRISCSKTKLRISLEKVRPPPIAKIEVIRFDFYCLKVGFYITFNIPSSFSISNFRTMN